jgi:hypothetical protein
MTPAELAALRDAAVEAAHLAGAVMLGHLGRVAVETRLVWTRLVPMHPCRQPRSSLPLRW